MTFDANPIQQLIPNRVWAVDARLQPAIVVDRQPVTVTGGPTNKRMVPVAEAAKQRMKVVRPGDRFGEPGDTWQQRWFVVEIPAAQPEECGQRYLRWECDGETTAWIDGQAWSGFDIAHREHLLPDEAVTIWLSHGTWQTAIWHADNRSWDRREPPQLHAAEIVVRDPVAWTAWHDFRALRELMTMWLADAGYTGTASQGLCPPVWEMPVQLRQLLRDLDQAVDVYDREGLEGFAPELTRLMKRYKGTRNEGHADVIGHAHLDLVWLWPESVTEHKGVHTFASMLRLMDRYPEFVFSQSSPWLYDAVGEQAPELLGEIKARIAEGRWEATGAMMVEADVTLPSGEGLARSLIYGQHKFTELTGSPSSVLWIPDVFGYSACLPQLMQLSGVDNFFTTKLTWNAVTRFPYSSLRWRGNDGSEVVTHLCPTGYNGECDITTLRQSVRANQQSAVFDGVLLPIGYGDGGGGVTEAQIERSRRFANFAGAPRTSWTTAESFFKRLGKVADQLPVYAGELYLEYHRGTYTSQSNFKRQYRRAERALQARESIRVLTGGEALAASEWERVLFAQFHDAIPGSSIKLVYDEMVPELTVIADSHEQQAVKELRTGEDTRVGGKRGESKRGWLIANPLPLAYSAVIELPDGCRDERLMTPAGETVATQAAAGGKRIAQVQFPGFGTQRLLPATESAGSNSQIPANALVADPKRLANDRLEARFDDAGQLIGLTIDGEPLAILAGTGFRMYPDNPANFDAWDIDRGTLALAQPCLNDLTLSVEEIGPVRAVLVGRSSLGDGSQATVRYAVTAGSDLLDVTVEIDWRERHQLLKYHCVTEYRGAQARFGAPFTSVQRPQLPGLHSDESQWEVPGSRWAAVMDDDQQTGLAMIAESRYGFSCRDGDLGLSLLRAPTYPDPECDQGVHSLAFALGRWRSVTSECSLATAAAAEARWATHTTTAGGTLLPSPFACENLGSLTPAAVKPAEDGDGFVIRLHECAGSRGEAIIELAARPSRVELVDLLERRTGRLRRIDQHRYALPYAPYQIISVRVTPKVS